ncbi:MAG TPA: Ni/Fe hydrogenase subunit alpha [Vicinamibacterales bacterium]|nr:Ni/Fe hydrogenase subunit alpha [Vicinamibacterales bacterium]
MPQTIVVDPVTRIEGHAKITIHLDDQGEVRDARFHVTEFRGFEKFCEGRHFQEMPTITSRVCGICPVSHMLASAHAGDDVLAVEIPPTAVRLRRLINLAQLVQSHALSFFHLTSPDLLLGYDAAPAERSILGVAARHPELARGGIRLRQFGQTIIELLAGKRIHPSWAVAGGVMTPLAAAARERILRELPEAQAIASQALAWFKRELESHEPEARAFGNFPTLFLGMVTPDGELEHYGGLLRIVDASGNIVVDRLDGARCRALIAEAVEPWSYLKFPYYAPQGYPGGIYRVGPLARLNVASRCGTPLADAELAEFRQLGRGAVLSSFHYHYARLIEVLYGLERISLLLDDQRILDDDVLARAARNREEGLGVSEAPRGTLFHHYKVDRNGLLTWVDLLIATGQNNLAMNRAILQIARQFVAGHRLTEGAINRVEAGIRAFDPCLSCSTHAVGAMPLRLQLVDAGGNLLHEIVRDR